MTPQQLIVDGTRFDLTVLPVGAGWHWLAARPGKILLSGEAPTELDAHRTAGATIAAWAELAAAEDPSVGAAA
jgi:hypothetical protein